MVPWWYHDGCMTPETCRVTWQRINVYILSHRVGPLLTLNHDARNHVFKILFSMFLRKKKGEGLGFATFWDITQHTVTFHHYTLHNIPEERSSHLLRVGSLKSQGEAFPKIYFLCFWNTAWSWPYKSAETCCSLMWWIYNIHSVMLFRPYSLYWFRIVFEIIWFNVCHDDNHHDRNSSYFSRSSYVNL